MEPRLATADWFCLPRRIGFASRREGKTVHRYIKGGYVRRYSDLLAILSLVAIVFVVGSGIYFLGESIHVPMHTRIFTGPVSTI